MLAVVAIAVGLGALQPSLPRSSRRAEAASASTPVDFPGARGSYDRRAALLNLALLPVAMLPSAASASGGATAGKYTTIPIAKRRYFGRVKQGVYEYLTVGAAIKKGELGAENIDEFFADTILVKEARQKKQCVGDASACLSKEKFSSRWEDLKLSMFLLGNAFRMDSGKPPEKVKQVKEAQAFFAQVEKLRKARLKGDKKAAALTYAASIEALETFLNDVDLPPTAAPDYAQAADLEVMSLCQGSFCI